MSTFAIANFMPCNPRTGEPVAVPASKVPSFKPAKALRDAVDRERT